MPPSDAHVQEVRYKRIYERRSANLSWTMDLMACWLNGQVIALLVHFPPILERSATKAILWTQLDIIGRELRSVYQAITSLTT